MGERDMRIIIGISGASGAIYGVRLLKALESLDVETYLVVTRTGEKLIEFETDLTRKDLLPLATHHYEVDDLASPISSGSFRIDGMVVAPCSMKTLAGIANGYSDNLLLRAADVTLKEGRPLVLVPRETPLNIVHIKNMLKVVQAGAIILPSMPGFYHKPKSVDDLVNYIVGKILNVFDLEHELCQRYKS